MKSLAQVYNNRKQEQTANFLRSIPALSLHERLSPTLKASPPISLISTVHETKMHPKGFFVGFPLSYISPCYSYVAHRSNKQQFKFLSQQGTKDSHWTTFYYLLGGIPYVESERLKQYVRHVPAAFTSLYNPNLPGTIPKVVIVHNYVQNKHGAERREEKCGLN